MYSRIAILVLCVCLATAGPIEDYRRLAQTKAFLTYLQNSEDAPSQNEKRIWGAIKDTFDKVVGNIHSTAEGLLGAAAGVVDHVQDTGDAIRDDAANVLGGVIHDALLGVADGAEGAGGVVNDLMDHLGLSSETGLGADILGLLVKDGIIQTALEKCNLLDFVGGVTDREIQQEKTMEERQVIEIGIAALIAALGAAAIGTVAVGTVAVGVGTVAVATVGTAVGLCIAAETAGVLAVGTTVAVIAAYEAARLAKDSSKVACDALRDTLTEVAEENNKITEVKR